MKIFFCFEIKKSASGGGNQFLKSLKNRLESNGHTTEDPADADIIVFNSYQYIDELIDIYKKFPNKTYIHRIDGPIRLYNSMSDKRDHVTNYSNRLLADATIFQSKWSQDRNYQLGLKAKDLEVTIKNAPDENIFKPSNKKLNSEKIKIVSTSWSPNWKKGFNDYKWLDENLDFNKYEYTFVGNSPVKFKNINLVPPQNSPELAKIISDSDIYITASINDPCSNSHLEALYSKKPVIALNSGGHPELIQSPDYLYNKVDEVPGLLKKLEENYSQVRDSIKLVNLDSVTKEYYDFFLSCGKVNKNKGFVSARVTIVKAVLFYWKLSQKLKSIFAR